MTTASAAPAPAASGSQSAGSDPFALPEDQIEHMDDVFGFGQADAALADTNSNEGLGGASSSEDPAVGAADGEGEGQPPASQPSPEPAAAPDDRDLELADVKGRLEALTKQLEERQQPPAATPEAEAPQTPAAPQPVKINLPAAFKDRVFGESAEDAGAALDELVSGIYTTMNQAMHQLVTSIPQLIQQEIAKGTKSVASEKPAAQPANPGAVPPASEPDPNEAYRQRYFDKFPQHKSDAIRPILQAVAAEMANQFPSAPFDDKYIASLGSRVEDRVRKLAELSRPGNASAPLPAGTRSAEPVPGGADISDQIKELFD